MTTNRQLLDAFKQAGKLEIVSHKPRPKQKPTPPPNNMTPQQIAAANAYDGGEHSHIVTEANWRRDVHLCGDTLFQFLMAELSAPEGCDSDETALRRLRTAANQINQVIAAIQPGTAIQGKIRM